MARLHHVTRPMQSAAGRPPDPAATFGWRASRPVGTEFVPTWFSVTPLAPSTDTRVAKSAGLLATLETCGGMTGPATTTAADGEGPAVFLGGATAPRGSGAPASFGDFYRDRAVVLSLWASGLGAGRQVLVVFGVTTDSPEHRVTVQSFAGLVPIAEDVVAGDDRIAFCVDGGDDGKLALRLVLRMCDAGEQRLGVRGAVGYLL